MKLHLPQNTVRQPDSRDSFQLSPAAWTVGLAEITPDGGHWLGIPPLLNNHGILRRRVNGFTCCPTDCGHLLAHDEEQITQIGVRCPYIVIRSLCGGLVFLICRLRWVSQSVAILLLQLGVIGDQARRVVVKSSRDAMPHLEDFVDWWIALHGLPPSSSNGVTIDGTKRPSMVLMRRMWPNLLALARCSQFHVTRKSHL